MACANSEDSNQSGHSQSLVSLSFPPEEIIIFLLNGSTFSIFVNLFENNLIFEDLPKYHPISRHVLHLS